jgi:hypothetical protein
MSLFDLLFLAAALLTMVTLLVAAILVLRGRGAAAARVLAVLATSAAIYITTGLVLSLLRPQRVWAVGQPSCSDDWCLAAERVTRTTAEGSVDYSVELRVFSRARRVSQRASGAWIFLIDDHGRRYSPEHNPSDTPLDLMLGPGESVRTSRVFRVPAGAHVAGIITGHGGRYCGPMDILVIGESGCVFGKPAMIRID